MQDRHVRYCETEATSDISFTSICKILHDHLAVKKICSCWILHNLRKPCVMFQAEWKKCSDTWFERMQRCIDNKGEYFEKE